MSQAQTRTLTLGDGTDVDVTALARVDEETLRVEIDGECRWQLQVEESGNYELEASWDRDSQLADVPLPDCLEDALELIGTRI